MNPLNLGGVLMGVTFMASGIYFVQNVDTHILKILSASLIGLGGYIVWLHYINDNYMVNV